MSKMNQKSDANDIATAALVITVVSLVIGLFAVASGG